MGVAIVNPGRVTIPMLGRHLKWLNDGHSFLAHVDDLADLKIVAVCVRCVPAHATARIPEGSQAAHVHCGCRAGTVRLDKGDLSVSKLLGALGWALRCTDCGDAVEGNNDPLGTRYTVQCPCTTREFALVVH